MNSRSPTSPLCAALGLVLAATQTLHSQVIPTTPSGFATRAVGNSGAVTGIVSPPSIPQTTTRTVTRIVLSPVRQWKTTDGKSFTGKLIAFDDLVAEKNAGNGTSPAPQDLPPVPKQPTVVRDGKARFLVDAKPYDFALERLGEEDRKFIENIRAGVAAKK